MEETKFEMSVLNTPDGVAKFFTVTATLETVVFLSRELFAVGSKYYAVYAWDVSNKKWAYHMEAY
jgi:hypothetical protein